MTNSKRKGVIGALLDEYNNVITDLKNNIKNVKDSELKIIADKKTKNKDCVSIQSNLTHIIFCGYNYLTMIDIHRGNADSLWPSRVYYDSLAEYNESLDKMYDDTVKFFETVKESEMCRLDPKKKIVTWWGQYYDYEQLMEHAIVHVSRHRRQIEKFKLKVKS